MGLNSLVHFFKNVNKHKQWNQINLSHLDEPVF